ncbi:hypothetical protein ACQP0I_16030 [Micromonospora carbonacea]|uniref:hypothetical protein n=1 Tax=Micromonospora carbonacea TaxID=47853 RepID=UPI003D97C71F
MAVWHAPLFVILATFRGFRPAVLPGFFPGMVAGAVILAFVYNAAGVAAAACWHVAYYNLSSASAAASGTVAAVSTAVVMLWAVHGLACRPPRRAVAVARPEGVGPDPNL